jgi:hypothetical protein
MSEVRSLAIICCCAFMGATIASGSVAVGIVLVLLLLGALYIATSFVNFVCRRSRIGKN